MYMKAYIKYYSKFSCNNTMLKLKKLFVIEDPNDIKIARY